MRRDLIVIGASRGGAEAFSQLVRELPADLDAIVLLVMHLAPTGPSLLAGRLRQVSSLPVAQALDGEELTRGRIYVGVPDRHLMIEGDRVRLSRGPKESHARPSVDVLFRSAAYAFGARVIGVVLTGQLDDGTAGLWAIKDRGGVAIVQDPQEAPFPSMPRSALDHVAIDFTLRIHEMAGVLGQMTREPVKLPGESLMSEETLALETGIALEKNVLRESVRKLGSPSVFTCPECHGSMVSIQEGPLRRYRCHTGHGFTQGALRQEGMTQIERTLWSALAQIEEQKLLQLELADQAAAANRPELEAQFRNQATRIDGFADRARALALDTLISEQLA